jgi:hypothetical protein
MLMLAALLTCANRVIASQHLLNTLVIENRTAYSLEVYRDGSTNIWKAERRDQNGQHLIPVIVQPHTTLAVTDCNTNLHEQVVLKVVATKGFMIGCVPHEVCMGAQTNAVSLGINEPAKLIVVNGKGLR